MALQLASESLGESEERDFQRRRENPPSPATERRLLLTAKRFHTVCLSYARTSTARSRMALVGVERPTAQIDYVVQKPFATWFAMRLTFSAEVAKSTSSRSCGWPALAWPIQ